MSSFDIYYPVISRSLCFSLVFLLSINAFHSWTCFKIALIISTEENMFCGIERRVRDSMKICRNAWAAQTEGKQKEATHRVDAPTTVTWLRRVLIKTGIITRAHAGILIALPCYRGSDDNGGGGNGDGFERVAIYPRTRETRADFVERPALTEYDRQTSTTADVRRAPPDSFFQSLC